MSNQEFPKIIPGFEKYQAFNSPELAEWRWQSALGATASIAADTNARVQASKADFPWAFFRGDCHSHSQHSDGISTIAEIAEMVKTAGLDFQFVTDHWGVTQADECREHGLWYGQEPGTALHHMGILGLHYAFEPKMDFLADMQAAADAGATVYVPHPTGWWPVTVYNDEQKNILEQLPSPFLMEICNGAANIVSAFDYTDESAVELWDQLLLQGKVVHAMGNTDAHLPHGIGMVWNGVFAEQCDQASIISALKAGHSFVSDAPLVHIAQGKARMGDAATIEDRQFDLQVTLADSRGLNSVSVVADGVEIFYNHFRGDTAWKGAVTIPHSAHRYVRVAVTSRDGRQAYSNPIYLTEM